MDATVNDFFNEINQISSKNSSKETSEVWQECFDELTGYSYFWNTETDEVTWVPPKSYKAAETGSSKGVSVQVEKEKKRPELFVPPAAATKPQYSTASVKPEAKLKVYTIQEAIKKPEVKLISTPFLESKVNQQTAKRKPFIKPGDSDDEKIELISEYRGESDSDEEITSNSVKQKDLVLKKSLSPVRTIDSPIRKPIPTVKKPVPPKRGGNQSDNDEEDDEDDDIDLLAKIQQRAQELKKLGGEMPPGVKDIIQNSDGKEKIEKPKNVSGFSLVAGYNSDSSDTEPDCQETLPPKPVFPMAPPPQPISETSHSTLFPITKPIDVTDFIQPEPIPSEVKVKGHDINVPNDDFDNKAFQRKRRIGISLVNNVKRPKEDIDMPSTEFTGLGFKSEGTTNVESKVDKESAISIYPGFQKGGVMFMKSDTLNPTSSSNKPEKLDKLDGRQKDNENATNGGINREETEDNYTVLREKLLFLGEGREPVLPVQVMLIQAETLFLAMKEDGLKLSYLHKWLIDMCSELIKLEKEAAPEGWLLQWDRSHKRYFYQNQVTGVSQWRYPEPDVTRCDDAMDICTTPPPQILPDEIESSRISPVMFESRKSPDLPLPPSPPKIRSPTPPPPPVISMKELKPIISDVPLPPDPLPPEPPTLQPPLPPLKNGQPLPPGVDLLDSYDKSKELEGKTSDKLITALDSFYSEIAEVSENTNSSSPKQLLPLSETPIDSAQDSSTQQTMEVSKKKRRKVKLAQGLTMKKKGVSQLVEKWKNVQKNYGD